MTARDSGRTVSEDADALIRDLATEQKSEVDAREDLHTRGSETERWTLTGARAAQVVVVVRDLRGGSAWAVRDVVGE